MLEDAYNLFHFNREVTELHVYISSKEVVASSGDLGRDYEHVQVQNLLAVPNLLFINYFEIIDVQVF